MLEPGSIDIPLTHCRTCVLLGDNPASFPYLRARVRVVSCMNGTDIRMFINAGLDARGLQSKLLITSLSE